jgi:hypothetical protein
MSTLAIENRFYQNSPEPSYLLRRAFSPEPSYALKDSTSSPPTIVDGITARVAVRLGTLPDARMNQELSEILKQFRLSATETEIDLSGMPALEIVDAEDGSVLIEWHLAGRRLGFNIEPAQGQSGWFYAFSRDSGGQCGSGSLASLDMKALFHTMLTTTPAR